MNSEKVDLLNTEEVNQAAYSFKETLRLAKTKTHTMTKKAMARVFLAVMEFPLAEVEPKFKNKDEHELFILTLTSMSAKNLMMNSVIENKLSKEKGETNG